MFETDKKHDRIHNLVRGGYNTRINMLAATIENLETKLVGGVLRPPTSLSGQKSVEVLEQKLADATAEYEIRQSYQRPSDVAHAIHSLTQTDFTDYLDGVRPEVVLGQAGLLEHCVMARFYKHKVPATGCRLRVYYDHVLVDDQWDEECVFMPNWARHIATLTTPPHYVGDYGEHLYAFEVQSILSSK